MENNIIEIHGFKFKAPKVLLYSNALSDIQRGDYYSAVNTFIQNLYIKGEDGYDLNDDEVTKIQLFPAIMQTFLTFKQVRITDTYTDERHKEVFKSASKASKVLAVVIGKPELDEDDQEAVISPEDYKVMFIKPLDRNDYKELFNKSFKSQMSALDWVLANKYVGGDKITKADTLDYVSCFSVSDFLLRYKEVDIKKK